MMADNRVGIFLGRCDAAVLRCRDADAVVRTSVSNSVARPAAVIVVGDDEVRKQYFLSAPLPLSLSPPPPPPLPPSDLEDRTRRMVD